VLDRPSPGTSFIVNAARARSTGIELELTGQPLYGLILGVNISYAKAETTEETVSAGGTIFDGTTLPWAPEVSGSVFADYAFSVREGLMGFVSADLQFMDEQFVVIQMGPDPLIPLDAYQTVSLRAGVMAASWTAQIFATNITDERAKLQDDWWPNQGWKRNRPRTIGLQFIKSF